MAFTSESSERPALVDRSEIHVAACVSRYHEELTGAMWASAKRELARAGVPEDGMRMTWVPGAFELPIVARRLAQHDDVDCVLAFGLVLKGETRHDEVIADAVASGLMQVSLETGKPVLLGVLTCDTIEKARARALPPDAGGEQDKGREVARAALDVLDALEEAGREADWRPRAGFPEPTVPATAGFHAQLGAEEER